MPTDMKPTVVIATGDPGGIGPEISMKAALDANVRALCRPVLVGDPNVMARHAKACGIGAEVRVVERQLVGDHDLERPCCDKGKQGFLAARGRRWRDGQTAVADHTSVLAIHLLRSKRKLRASTGPVDHVTPTRCEEAHAGSRKRPGHRIDDHVDAIGCEQPHLFLDR